MCLIYFFLIIPVVVRGPLSAFRTSLFIAPESAASPCTETGEHAAPRRRRSVFCCRRRRSKFDRNRWWPRPCVRVRRGGGVRARFIVVVAVAAVAVVAVIVSWSVHVRCSDTLSSSSSSSVRIESFRKSRYPYYRVYLRNSYRSVIKSIITYHD